MKPPFFSIIIPVFNVEKYIKRCLQSIINQGLNDSSFEVIIVNDGTPDNSMQIVQDFAKTHSNFVIINKVNGGVSSARNEGIKISKGKYILFVDPDDEIGINSLSAIYNELSEKSAEILILNSYIVDLKSGKNEYKYPFPIEKSGELYSGVDLFEFYNRGSICGVVFERLFIIKNNIRFEEDLRNGEDSIFFSYCLIYANRIYHQDNDYYIIHRRDDSASVKWDYKRVYSLTFAFNIIGEKIKTNSLSEIQQAILYQSAYQTISNVAFQFSKINKLSKFCEIKRAIKQSSVYPIKNKHIKGAKKKVVILNISVILFLFLFLFREKFGILFNIRNK